ncbi:MAG: hypothetical protein ACRDFZ_01685 [Candidatus Limnocylindria bacterium]
MPSARRDVDGVLVLYHFIPPYAETVLEHATALERHSRFRVWNVNTAERFPTALRGLRFRAVVLHYSLFGSAHYQLSPAFLEYLRSSRDSLRVAFFQDEHAHTGQRLAFLDEHAIDWVYTLLQPKDAERVYGQGPGRPRLISTIPGYVGGTLLDRAARFARPEAERHIDIGYRARTLPYYLGRGAREKSEIGRQFAARATDLGLNLDIATDEADRLYGDAWYRFLGSSRAVLGVEAGVSIFDINDQVRPATEAFLARHPSASFEEVEAQVLQPWEDNIPYRTISPRHFEAAAFDTCQILFEGSYSGILASGTHYIQLRKDFSNFDEVIQTFRNAGQRARIVANARRDLIESGRYGYAAFIRSFDDALAEAGISPPPGPRPRAVDDALARGAWLRRTERRLRTAYWRFRLALRRAR